MNRPADKTAALFFVEIFFADLYPVDAGGGACVDSLQDRRKGIGGSYRTVWKAVPISDIAEDRTRKTTADEPFSVRSRRIIEAGHGRERPDLDPGRSFE